MLERLLKVDSKMVVFALTLIRHGETGANKDKIVQGQMDVPLSAAGLVQADLLGDRLQYQRYTHVFASDLVRAQQTLKTILDKSHFVKFSVVSDERLRERKYGEVEGKSVCELKKLARLAHQTPPNFTPCGAETIQQLRDRAVLFFRELCQQLLQMHGKVVHESDASADCFDDDCLDPAPPKRRRHNSSTDESVAPVVFEEKEMTLKVNGEMPKHDRRPSFEPIRSDLVTYTQAMPSPIAAQLCVYVPSRRSRQINCTKILSSKVSHPPATVAAPYATMDMDCPNVTLFPLGEHKCPNSVSDRKSSVDSLTDDLTAGAGGGCGGAGGEGPDLRPAANVLVVSHGGLLREMIRHFVEDLGCAVPGGKGQALRLSPNTGLSKFTVSLEKDDEDPKIICLLIHDKDHLVAGQVTALNSTAL